MFKLKFLSGIEINLNDKDKNEEVKLKERLYSRKLNKQTFEDVKLTNGKGYHYIINRGLYTFIERENSKKYSCFYDVLKEIKKVVQKDKEKTMRVLLVYRGNLYEVFTVSIVDDSYTSYWSMSHRYYDSTKNCNVSSTVQLFTLSYDKEDDCHTVLENNISDESNNLFSYFNSIIIKVRKTSEKVEKLKKDRMLEIENKINKIKVFNINDVIINNYYSNKIINENLNKLIISVSNLNRVFDTSLFNPVNFIGFDSSKKNDGHYSIELKKISLSKNIVNSIDFNPTFYHEYGHHIYYEMYKDLEVVAMLNFWHGEMLKKETLNSILTSKLSIKRVKYLTSETEVFARLFEHLIICKVGDELSTRSNWYFTNTEVDEFNVLLEKIIDLYMNNKNNRKEVL